LNALIKYELLMNMIIRMFNAFLH